MALKKLELSNDQWKMLRDMITLLYPVQKIEKTYGDGMITLQCRDCLRIQHFHWYELLLDHLLVSIAKRLEPKIWLTYHAEIIRNLYASRTSVKNTKIIHPLDNAYLNYFLPNINELQRSNKAKPAVVTKA